MKNKSRIFIVFAVVLLALLAVASPLFAYDGVSGMVIDSRYGQGWQHGGDVYVENISNINNPKLISTCTLGKTVADAGDFDCVYGTNGISAANFDGGTPSSGEEIRITIDFTCAGTSNCTGSIVGTPATLQITYIETTNLPGRNALGYIQTGTGPTAIELADLSVAPESTNWGIVTLVALLGAVTLSAFVILRNRRAAAYIDS